jgi:hypothetical protein
MSAIAGVVDYGIAPKHNAEWREISAEPAAMPSLPSLHENVADKALI